MAAGALLPVLLAAGAGASLAQGIVGMKGSLKRKNALELLLNEYGDQARYANLYAPLEFADYFRNRAFAQMPYNPLVLMLGFGPNRLAPMLYALLSSKVAGIL